MNEEELVEFDLEITDTGEIVLDDQADWNIAAGDDLRLQLAVNRIKSVTTDWFNDELCGANLEELIGRECSDEMIEEGERKITESLLLDALWDEEDFYIQYKIEDNTHLKYAVFFRVYVPGYGDPQSYTVNTFIDLVKGVYIDYGWKPRNHVPVTFFLDDDTKITDLKELFKTLENTSVTLYNIIKDETAEPYVSMLAELQEYKRLKGKYLNNEWDHSHINETTLRLMEINHRATKMLKELNDLGGIVP